MEGMSGQFKGRNCFFAARVCLEMRPYCFVEKGVFFLPRSSAFVRFGDFFASSALKVDCSTSRSWCMRIFGIRIHMN